MAESLRPRSYTETSAAVGRDRQLLLERLGEADAVSAASQTEIPYATSDPPAEFPKPQWSRYDLLGFWHRVLEPRTYLEIGVDVGRSLSLSRATSIAIDPDYAITQPISCDLRTFLEPSDQFFARDDAMNHFDGLPIDLAFIDGMHLSEYALRDFINVEKNCGPGSIVVVDDVLPRNSLEACRVRRTRAWAGDVFRLCAVLATCRPDLDIFMFNTSPTGTMVIANLDPSSTVLERDRESLERELAQADPPLVPQEVLGRALATNPSWLSRCEFWGDWTSSRNAGAGRETFRSLVASMKEVRDSA